MICSYSWVSLLSLRHCASVSRWVTRLSYRSKSSNLFAPYRRTPPCYSTPRLWVLQIFSHTYFVFLGKTQRGKNILTSFLFFLSCLFNAAFLDDDFLAVLSQRGVYHVTCMHPRKEGKGGVRILQVTFSEKGTRITPQTYIQKFEILEIS